MVKITPRGRTRKKQYDKNPMTRTYEPTERIINPKQINVLMKSVGQITDDVVEVLEYIEKTAKPAYHQDSVEHKFVLRLKHVLEATNERLSLFLISDNISLAGRNNVKTKKEETVIEIPSFLPVRTKWNN